MRQSDRIAGLQGRPGPAFGARASIYPCRCTRADIRAALSAPQEGVAGPDGPVYPGTCRGRSDGRGGATGCDPAGHGSALSRLAPQISFRRKRTLATRTFIWVHQPDMICDRIGRCRAGPARHGHVLSPVGDGRRCRAGRDRGGPWRGPVRGHLHPCPASDAASASDAKLLPSRPDPRRRWQAAGQARRCARAVALSCDRGHAGRISGEWSAYSGCKDLGL